MRRMLGIGFMASLLLAGCGGSGSAEVSCANAYWDGTVGTCLPSGWIVLDRAMLDQRGAPPEVITAFQADKPVSGQFPTVTVTREMLKQPMTSKEYSDASLQSVTGLPGYEEGDTRTVTIDGESVALHTFTAQPRSDEPRIRFYQVSIAGEGAGYTYTGALPLTVAAAVQSQVTLVLQNATLKQAAAE